MNRRNFIQAALALAGSLIFPKYGAPATISGGVFSGGSVSGGGGSGPISQAIIPTTRQGFWNPGIYGGIPADGLGSGAGPNGVGGAAQHGSTITATTGDRTATIQSALNAAGSAATKADRKYVLLGAGEFDVTQFSIPSYVTLRGTLAAGNVRQTILNQTSTNENLVIMAGNRGSAWGTLHTLTSDALKGDDRISLNTVSGLAIGDLICLDQLSDGSSKGADIGLTGSEQANTSGIVRDWDATPTASGKAVFWDSSLYYSRANYTLGSGFTTQTRWPDSTGSTTNNPDGWRQTMEFHEIIDISGSDIIVYVEPTNLSQESNADISGAPVRLPYFNSAEVYKCSGADGVIREYAGVEDLQIHPNGTNGKSAIYMAFARFCWIRNVECNGLASETGNTWSGRHIQLQASCYRCEIAQSYWHHSSNYAQGANAYGLNFQGSDCYVHDNVAVALNKCITLENSNGGNVFAYNYVDDAIISANQDQNESAIGTHGSFCHNELFEGNITSNITVDSTHGNNGFNVAFRNHCTGRNSWNYAPAGYPSGGGNGWARAFMSDYCNWELTTIGNVLYTDTVKAGRIVADAGAMTLGSALSQRNAYFMGFNGWSGVGDSRDDGFAYSNLYRHLDFVYYTGGDELIEDVSNVETLPDSLHRTTAPSYFSGYTWPTVDPEGASFAAKVATLPAKARLDAGEA